MSFVSHIGKIVQATTPLVSADHPGLKWGDGLFETMKIVQGQIALEQYHFERLKKGLEVLRIEHDDAFFNRARQNIYALCHQNNCLESGRARMAVYRNNEGGAETVIEAFRLDSSIHEWNETGWKAGIFDGVVKPLDALSNLKTASFLPYVLAARHAREKGWDESFILNSNGAICDGSRTNMFIIAGATLYTPALQEGCVAGVMRRHIINELRGSMPLVETILTINDLLKADEMFVTNAIIGLKWVQSFGEKLYGFEKGLKLYKRLCQG